MNSSQKLHVQAEQNKFLKVDKKVRLICQKIGYKIKYTRKSSALDDQKPHAFIPCHTSADKNQNKNVRKCQMSWRNKKSPISCSRKGTY